MSDLTGPNRKKEVSTKALLEQSRSTADSIRGALSDPATDLATGTRFDKNKLPDQMTWDKTKSEKVQVMENPSAKMIDKMRNPAGLN